MQKTGDSVIIDELEAEFSARAELVMNEARRCELR